MALEQTCTLIGMWLEPKYVIPALMVLLSSGLFPILLHKYKVKREREEKLFDTRKEEYQAYFKKFEKAANLAGQDYDKYLTETFPEALQNLLESNCSPEALVEYQNTLNNFTKSINEGFQKAAHEFTGLRIVCSAKLGDQLDAFEETYKQMMLLQPTLLKEIKESITEQSFAIGEFNFETPSKLEMVALGKKIASIRNEIIKTMRHELGFKK